MNEIMNTPRIIYSIIIPHKNIFKYLKRCVDSIPIRDDTEVIIVDDNSSDSQKELLKGIQRENTKIIFTSEGKGAGFARNKGLSIAKGSKILFADADDFFTSEIDRILDNFSEDTTDIIYFKIISKDCETLKPSTRGNFVNRTIDQAKDNPDFLRYKRLEPWAKIIQASLIRDNGISFDETIAANDLMFSTLTGFFAKKVKIEDTVLYCLTQRENSLAYTVSGNVCIAKFEVIRRVNTFLINNGKGRFHINIYPYIWNMRLVSKKLFLKYMFRSLFSYRTDYVVTDLLKSLCKTIQG